MREALFRNHRIIYGAFDYYASLYSEEAIAEVDVWNLTFNAYLAFCSTCKIATREVRLGIVSGQKRTSASLVRLRHERGHPREIRSHKAACQARRLRLIWNHLVSVELWLSPGHGPLVHSLAH